MDHSHSIHQGAVLAVKVAHGNIAVFHNQCAVVAGDNITVWSQLTITITANEKLRAGNLDFLAAVRTAYHHQL